MRILAIVGLSSLLALQAPLPVETLVERLATCQDSWRDWKDHPAEAKRAAELFRDAFAEPDRDGSFAPRTKLQVAGLPVVQVYPESVGMGVGFSVVLDAPFDVAREHAEQAIGKPLGQCERGDGMRTCGLEIAEQRTITLMGAEDGALRRTLLGCFYFYAK